MLYEDAMKRTIQRVWAPFLLVLMGLAQGPAATPAPPVQDPNESAVVQELFVTARYPGPALWTVQRGQGTVVVLGGLSPLPHMLQWDSHRLEHAMEGADLVLLPPTGRLGPLDLIYILFHAGDLRLPGGQTLWDQLTPEQKRRFDNLRTQIKQESKHYERLKPAIAGVLLLGDFEKGAGLSSAKPGSTVKDLAEARHIPTRPEGGIPVADVFRAVVRMDDRQGADCLDALLSETERIASRARPLADAWANGDLNAVKGEYLPAGVERCIAGASGLQAFSEKLTRDATASLDAALNKGGKTVAVVDLRLLLRADGVLDRLKAAGATVKAPRS
jgi:uncharacterized protein YbaP (TraB family)